MGLGGNYALVIDCCLLWTCHQKRSALLVFNRLTEKAKNLQGMAENRHFLVQCVMSRP